MSTTETSAPTLLSRPKRADARRNYDKVLAAAREAFAEGGESTALEEIARRADVGIGTLYRHFPSRQALLEALYVDEVEEVCRSAAELENAEPWEAFSGWIECLIGYVATKRALASELLNYLDHDASLFQVCRASLFAAGEPLLTRGQDAGVIRQVCFGNRQCLYEVAADQEASDHLMCVATGKVITLDSVRLRQICEEICREHGFELVSHQVRILGISPEGKLAAEQGEPLPYLPTPCDRSDHHHSPAGGDEDESEAE